MRLLFSSLVTIFVSLPSFADSTSVQKSVNNASPNINVVNEKVPLSHLVEMYLNLPDNRKRLITYELEEFFIAKRVPKEVLRSKRKKNDCSLFLMNEMIDSVVAEVLKLVINKQLSFSSAREQLTSEQINGVAFEAYTPEQPVTLLTYPKELYGDDGYILVSSFTLAAALVNQELLEIGKLLGMIGNLKPQFLEPIFYTESKGFNKIKYRILTKGQPPAEKIKEFYSGLADQDEYKIANDILRSLLSDKTVDIALAKRYFPHTALQNVNMSIFDSASVMNVPCKKTENGSRIREFYRIELRQFGSRMYLDTYLLQKESRQKVVTREIIQIIQTAKGVEYHCGDGTILLKDAYDDGSADFELM